MKKRGNKVVRGISMLLCVAMMGQSILADTGMTVYADTLAEASIEEMNGESQSQVESPDVQDDIVNPEEGPVTEPDEDTEIAPEEEGDVLEHPTIETGAVMKDSATIRWKGQYDSKVSRWVLYRDGEQVNEQGPASWYDPFNTYVDTEVECGMTYVYKAVGFDSEGTIVAESDELSVEVRDVLMISDYYYLQSDLTTSGIELNGSNAQLYTNGYSVTVTGDVVCKNGYLSIGSQLVCDNLIIGENGSLRVNDGTILVNNKFEYGAAGIVDASRGSIEVKGDFVVSGKGGFTCGSGHEFVFSGDHKQTIDVREAKEASFGVLKFANTSEEGVEILGDFNLKNYETNGCRLTMSESSVYIGWTLEKDETITGDFGLITGILDLNGHTLTIKGNLLHSNGEIRVNGGKLIVEGDYEFAQKTVRYDSYEKKDVITYQSSQGLLSMNSSDDQVLIYGDYIVNPNWLNADKITDGTIEVKGNCTFSGGEFCIGEAASLILSGDQAQTVSVPKDYSDHVKIANLELKNTSDEGITFKDNGFLVTKSLKQNDSKYQGCISVTGAACEASELFQAGIRLVDSLTLQNDMTIQGCLYLDNDNTVNAPVLDLNGYKLTVQKDTVLKNGVLNINKGQFVCMQSFHTPFHYGLAGRICMENEEDYFCVKGDATFEGGASGKQNVLTAGTMEIGGDFSAYDGGSYNSFKASGTHKILLSGSSKQTVKLGNMNVQPNIVEMSNTSEDGIYIPEAFWAKEVQRNCPVTYGTKGFSLTGRLESDVFVLGNINLASDTLSLSGYTLTLDGDFYHGGGELKLNYGTLVVKGNYYYQNMSFDTNGDVKNVNASNGKLTMNCVRDHLVVEGNLDLYPNYASYCVISNGVLEVHGDVTCKSAVSMTDNAKLLLSGTKKQNISFISSSSVNDLEVTNSNGVEFVDPIRVIGNVNEHDCTHQGMLAIGSTTTFENGYCGGDCKLDTQITLGDNLTVLGDCLVERTLDLNGKTLHINGDLNVEAGSIAVGQGRLECDKNVNINSQGGNGYISMNSKDGYVFVGENLSVHYKGRDYYGLIVYGGTIEVKGDFTSTATGNGTSAFYTPSGKMIFSGTQKQTVLFEGSQFSFDVVELQNHSSAGIYAPAGLPCNSIIWNGCRVDDGTGDPGIGLLTEDKEIDGDYILDKGEVDLNGHTLTVHGNLYQSDGSMRINGGKLIVEGDYHLQKDQFDESGNIVGSSSSAGTLFMTDEKDDVLVKGDFSVNTTGGSKEQHTAGTLEVQGNVTNRRGFYVEKEFKLLLSGEGAQTVNVPTGSADSISIKNLEITNESEQGVTFSRATYVPGTIDTHENTYHGSLQIGKETSFVNGVCGGNLLLRETRSLTEPLHVLGDLKILECNMDCNSDLIVDGDFTLLADPDVTKEGTVLQYSQRATLTLTDNQMTVKGNISMSNAIIDFKNAKVYCDGNFVMAAESYYVGTMINMTHDSDYLSVKKNFTVSTAVRYGSSELTAGTIEIGGDFTQSKAPNFAPKNNHKVVLNGSKKQIISFETDTCGFNILDIQNTSQEGVCVTKPVLNCASVTGNSSKLHLDGHGIAGWTLEEDTVIEGDVFVAVGCLDLNGYTLKIVGNLYMGAGSLKINGGTLEVTKDFRMQVPNYTSTGTVVSFVDGNALLEMNQDGDRIVVGGTCAVATKQKEEGHLTAGTLELYGDFQGDGSFAPSDNHTILLCGSKAQKITVKSSSQHFNILKVMNTSSNGVTLGSDIYVKKQLADPDKKIAGGKSVLIPSMSVLQSDFGGDICCINDSTLDRDYNIGGNFIAQGNADLNGHVLNVKNMEIWKTISINGGTLNVNGDMSLLAINSCLNMTNEDDYVFIRGTLENRSYTDHAKYLTAGTLELQGNLVQRVESEGLFGASGNHETIFSANPNAENRNYVQTISTADPNRIHLNKVVLKRRDEFFAFSPDTISFQDICNTLEKAVPQDVSAPEKVTGLTVKSCESTKITILWNSTTDDGEVIGYDIYRNDEKVGSSSELTFVDAGLQPNTKYVYKITAFDTAHNVSEYSEELEVITKGDTSAPTVPTGLKIDYKTGSAITIGWNAASDDVGISGYQIYKEGEKIAEVASSVTSYRDAFEGDENELYHYQVQAVDTAGNVSGLSTSITGSLQFPEILSVSPADNAQIGGNKVEIKVFYKTAGNATGNRVKFEYLVEAEGKEPYWEQIGGMLYGQKAYDSRSSYSSCIWDFSSVKTASCDMRATLLDEDGNEDVAYFTYYVDTQGPEAVSQLNAKSENGVVQLTWSESDSSDVAKYLVYRSESSNGQYVKIAEAEDCHYDDIKVVAKKTYYYKISGVDGYNQEGNLSDAVSVVVVADEYWPEVTSISVENQRINKVTTIKVNATDNCKVANITLEYQNRLDASWIVIDKKNKAADNNGTAEFSFDTTKLADGYYKLRAIATDASGNQSAGEFEYLGESYTLDPYYASVQIDNTGLSKLSIREATGYATYVTLKWNDCITDDYGYVIVEQLVGDSYKEVSRQREVMGAHITGLVPETEYTYRIVGYDDLGNRGIPSEDVHVFTTTDTQAPIITNFGPSSKYYNKWIPISISVEDNVGIKSLKLTCSTDQTNWMDLTTMEGNGMSSHTFHYSLDGTQYPEGRIYVRAYAYDLAGNESNYEGEPLSNYFVIDRTAPRKVTGVKATGESGYNVIRWTANTEPDIKGYKVYRTTVAMNRFTTISAGVGSNVYYDTAVNVGEQYKYIVVCEDFAGNISEYSAEAVAQCFEDNEAPVVRGISPQNNSSVTGKVELKALVTDNAGLSNIKIEYKEKDSKEDVWTNLLNQGFNDTTSYPTVIWNVDNLENKEYEVRVTAQDAKNNVSSPYVVTYMVDTVAPSTPEVQAEAADFGVKLTWEKNTEADFYYYKVMRRDPGEDDYKELANLKTNSFEDKNLKGGRKYYYKVYAYDTTGNVAKSKAVTATPTSTDKEAPVAICSEVYSARAGSEIFFDGRASRDNVKIVKYEWDFGNGDTKTGACVNYAYNEVGSYTGHLTVTDAAGNTNSMQMIIRVRSRISAQINFKVFNQRDNQNYVMDNAYIYIKSELGDEENYRADMYGELSVVLAKGKYEVDVYKEGFMPKHYDVDLSEGEELNQTLYLDKGELITTELTHRRLTPQEIVEKGVDLQNPSNWYEYEVQLVYRDSSAPVYHQTTLKLTPNVPVVFYSENQSSDKPEGIVVLTEVEDKKVTTVYRSVSYLKQMYDVELSVTNHAESGYGFDIVDSKATLKIPEGMSLAQTATPQDLTAVVGNGTVEAQKTASAHWYVKADRPGRYVLSARFDGTLMPFEAPVTAEIEDKSAITVEDGDEDNTFTDEGFAVDPVDYVVRVTNKHGTRLMGAIVTLSANGKKTQTITNSYGIARLTVNREDGRSFKLNVIDSKGLYEGYTDNSYTIQPNYTDTIKLYKPGESKEEEPDDTEEDGTKKVNPYLQDGEIGLVSACIDSRDMIYTQRFINRAEDKTKNLTFTFTDEISSYELRSSLETFATGEVNGDSLSIKVKGTDFPGDRSLKLTVYGADGRERTFDLNLKVEMILYDGVQLKYTSEETGRVEYRDDALSQGMTIFSGNVDDKIDIMCHVIDVAGNLIDHIELVHKNKVLGSSKTGEFSFTVEELTPAVPVVLIAYDKNDESIKRDYLAFNIVETPRKPKSRKISFSDGAISITLDKGTPIFGESTFSINLGDFTPDFTYEQTPKGEQITIGADLKNRTKSTKVWRFNDADPYIIEKPDIDLNDGSIAWTEVPLIGKEVNLKMGASGSIFCPYDQKEYRGEITIYLQASGSASKQFFVGGAIPVAVDVSVTGRVDATGQATFELTEDGMKALSGALDLALKLSIEGYAGLGLKDVMSAGLYGGADFNINFRLLPITGDFLQLVSIGGEMGVRAKFLNFTKSCKLVSGTYQIYPRVSNEGYAGMSFEEISAELADLDTYYLDEESRNNIPSAWYGAGVTDETDVVQRLQENVYRDARPNMITASGKTYMFYNNDDLEKDVANGSQIIYSVYEEDGTFAEPINLPETAFAQYGFDTYEENGQIYIIWQEANCEATSQNSLSEVAQSIELKAAKLNPETGVFTSLGLVTRDNQVFENMPQICAHNGQVYAVWAENTDNDIFGKKGTNKIYKSELSGNTWSAKSEVAEVAEIKDLDAGVVGSEISVSYVGGSFGVTSLATKEARLLDANAENVSFDRFDGENVLMWYHDGILSYLDDVSETEKAMFDDIEISSNGYRYISDGAESAIIYTQRNDNRSSAYLSLYDKDLKKWGVPQSILTRSEYLEDLAGAYEQGNLVLVFNQTSADLSDLMDNDAAIQTRKDLCCLKVGQTTKLDIDDFSYRYEDVIPGGVVPITVTVSNNSIATAKAEDITLTIKDEFGKTVVTKKAENPVRAGKTCDEVISLRLPYTLSTSSYSLEMMYQEKMISKQFTLGYADLEMEANVNIDHGKYSVEAKVENIGIEAAGGMIEIVNQMSGAVLYSGKLKELNYGEEKQIRFDIPSAVFDGSQKVELVVRVTTPEKQNREDNDEVYLLLGSVDDIDPQRVTFDYTDGTVVKKYVAMGSTVDFPEEPVKQGYTFDGWYLGDEKFSPDTPVCQFIKLEARFEKNKDAQSGVTGDTGSDSKGDVSDDKKDDDQGNSGDIKINLPKKNSKHTIGDIVYKVLVSDSKKGTVSAYRVANKKRTTIKIPKEVKIDGYTFKVTEVSASFMKNNKKVKKVTIGKNVAKIGSKAFSGCKNLKTIQVDSSNLKTVGKNAFYKINKSATIRVPNSKLRKYVKLLSKKGQGKGVKIKKK